MDSNFKLPTQVINAWPEAYVYCYKSNITIRGRTTRCPPFPFELNATQSWNTTDASHEQIEEIAENFRPFFNHDILTLHTGKLNGTEDATTYLDKIQDLNQKFKELRDKHVLLDLPVGELNYVHATSGLSLLLIIGIGIIIYLVYTKPNVMIAYDPPPRYVHPNARFFL